MSSERAVLYARVSGNDYDNEMSKLDGQIALCREYAEKKKYKVLHDFREPKYSGRAALDLPGLNEAIYLAHDDEFDVLVCREPNRLGSGVSSRW